MGEKERYDLAGQALSDATSITTTTTDDGQPVQWVNWESVARRFLELAGTVYPGLLPAGFDAKAFMASEKKKNLTKGLRNWQRRHSPGAKRNSGTAPRRSPSRSSRRR